MEKGCTSNMILLVTVVAPIDLRETSFGGGVLVSSAMRNDGTAIPSGIPSVGYLLFLVFGRSKVANKRKFTKVQIAVYFPFEDLGRRDKLGNIRN